MTTELLVNYENYNSLTRNNPLNYQLVNPQQSL